MIGCHERAGRSGPGARSSKEKGKQDHERFRYAGLELIWQATLLVAQRRVSAPNLRQGLQWEWMGARSGLTGVIVTCRSASHSICDPALADLEVRKKDSGDVLGCWSSLIEQT